MESIFEQLNPIGQENNNQPVEDQNGSGGSILDQLNDFDSSKISGEAKKADDLLQIIPNLEASSPVVPQILSVPEEFGRSQYDKNVTTKEQLYNLENFRGQQQTTLDKIGNAVPRFVVGVGTNVLGGLTGLVYGGIKSLYKAAEAPFDDKEDSAAEIFRNVYDNELFDALDYINEQTSEALPFYYTDLEKKKGLLSQAGTANFWFDKFANGLSFIVGAVLTEAAATGIGGFIGTALPGAGTVTVGGAAATGNLMRLNRLAQKIFKGSKAANTGKRTLDLAEKAGSTGRNIEGLKVLRQLGTGAMYESAIEARSTYDAVLENFLDNYGERFAEQEQKLNRPLTLEEKIQLLTPEERSVVDREATAIANWNWAGNMALVGFGNMVTLPRIYGKGMLDRMGNIPKKGLLGKVSEMTRNIPKDDLLDKGLAKINLGANTRGVANWLKRSAYEGVIEEGLQGVMAKASEDYALRSSLNDDGVLELTGDWAESISQGFKDTYYTTEGLTEVFIGSLAAGLGVPFTGGKGRGFFGGMVWTNDVQDQQIRRENINALTDYQKRFGKKIEDLEKKYPELQGKLRSSMYMLMQMSKNKEQIEEALKNGDAKKAKDLDFDDEFEYILHNLDTSTAEQLKKDIQEITSMDNKTFRELFQYDETMSDEDLQKRKGYLAEKLSADVDMVKKATESIDRAIAIKDTDKFYKMADMDSLAFKRRVLIHAASSIENRDLREKELIKKLAEITGGKIVNVEGEVDRIVYTDKQGNERTVSLGSMATGKTVGEQILDIEQRIDLIEKTPEKQRTQEDNETLSDLKDFLADLNAVEDPLTPVLPLLREAKSSLDKDTIEAWAKENIVDAAMNRKEVEVLMEDIRKLRLDRIRFANTLRTFLDPDLAKAETARLKKEKQQIEKIVKKSVDANTTRVGHFSTRMKNYKDDIEKRLAELNERLDESRSNLMEMHAWLLELKELQEKFESQPGRKRVKYDTKDGKYKLLTRKQIEEEIELAEALRDSARQEFDSLSQVIESEQHTLLETRAMLQLAIEAGIDPDTIPKEMQDIHKALVRLSGGEGLELYETTNRLIEQNNEAIDLLNQSKEEINGKIEELESLISKLKDFMKEYSGVENFDENGEWKNQFPAEELEALEKDLEQKRAELKELDKKIKRRNKRSQKILSAYLDIRLMQEMETIMSFPEKRQTGDDLDRVDDEGLPIDEASKDTMENYFMPDLNLPGFGKTSGKHRAGIDDPYEGALQTYERLKNTASTDAEKKALRIAESQLRWFKFLGSGGEDIIGRTKGDQYVMVLVDENNIPEELDNFDGLQGMFMDPVVSKETGNEDRDIKAVLAKVHTVKKKGKSKRVISYVQDEDGKYIFTSLPTPDLKINGRERYTNKEKINETDAQKKWMALRKKITDSRDTHFMVNISGKSPGTVRRVRGAKNSAKDAVMGGNLANIAVRVASVSKSETEPGKYKLAEVSFGNIKVKARPGEVWAYDHARHVPIPMKRSLLDRGNAEQVTRAFHLYLVKFQEGLDQGKSANQARKDALAFELVGKNDKGETVNAGPLSEFIDLTVFTTSKDSEFKLDIQRLSGKEIIAFGDMGQYMDLESMEDPSLREEFIEFLMTKRHNVKATKTKESTKRTTYKSKDGKKTYYNTSFADTGGNTYHRPLLNEDLSVGSVSTFKSYGEYLLTEDSGTKFKPLYTEAINRSEATLEEPRTFGGYLSLSFKGKEDGLIDIATFGKGKPYRSGKTESKQKKSSYSGPGRADIDDDVPTEDADFEEEFSGDQDPTQVQDISDLQAATIDDADPDDIVNVSSDKVKEFREKASKEPKTPKVKKDSPKPKGPEPKPTSSGNKVSLKFKSPFGTESISVNLDRLEIDDRTSEDNVVISKEDGKIFFSVSLKVGDSIVEANSQEAKDLTRENLENKFGQETDAETMEELYKAAEEMLFYAKGYLDTKDDDIPFLRKAQANRVNELLKDRKVMDRAEEISSVLGMRPLEIAEVDHLLASMDGKAEAQLVDYAKVLISRMASPGALFHEAFHDVSLYVLSPEDSTLLYRKVREIPGETVTYKGETKKMSELTDKEAEEWLAEEFRKFVLLGKDFKFGEGTVKDTRTMLQKFFDLVRNAIRRLLGLNETFEYDPKVSSIEGLFSDIKEGKFLKSGRNSLRTDPGKYDMLSDMDGYNSVYSKDFMSSLSGYVGQALNSTFIHDRVRVTIDRGMFLSSEKSKDPANKRRLYMAYRYAISNMRKDLLSSRERLEKISKPTSDQQLELDAVNSTLALIGEEQGENPSTERMLIQEHYMYLEFLGVSMDRVKEVEEEDVSSRDVMASDQSHLEISASETASGTTKLLLGTIIDPSVKNSTGLPGTYDMSVVLKTLQNELAGKMTWAKQLERLKEMSEDKRYPWAKNVIEIFDYEITDDMDPSTASIRTKFIVDMANTIADPVITKVEESNRIYLLDPVTAKKEGIIKSKWSANMKDMANRKSTYVSIKDGKIVIDPNAKFNLPTISGSNKYTTLKELRVDATNIKEPKQLLRVYKGLGIEFSNPDLAIEYLENREDVYEELVEDITFIIDDVVSRKEPFANLFDRRYADSVTRASKIARLEATTGESSIEGSYLNGAGKMEHNKMKNHAVSAIANFDISDLQDYYNPVSYPFGTGSLFLQEKLNGEQLRVINIAGLSPDLPGETGEKIGKLKQNDITVMHLANILNGVTIIPRAADKGTEFGIKLREDFEWPTTIEEAMEVMVGYLKSEIASSAMGIVEGQHIGTQNEKKPSYNRDIKELRIFKSISNNSKAAISDLLGSKTKMKKIRKEWIDSNGESDILDAFMEIHRDDIERDIREQMMEDVQDMLTFLEESKLVSQPDASDFRKVTAFSSEIFKEKGQDLTNRVSSSKVNKVLEEVVIRQFIGKNEVFRMFLNDPAFYSDLFKRISGAVSPKTMADISSDLMAYIRSDERLPGSGTKLPLLAIKEPVGYISKSAQQIYRQIISDPEVIDSWTDEISTDEDGSLTVKKVKLDKADGILPVSLPAFRAIKLGVGQWTDEMQEAYEYEMLLLDHMKKRKVINQNPSQDKLGAGFPVDKFQYFGPSNIGEETMHVPGFLKMSIMPIFPSLAYVNGVEYKNILKMIDAMEEHEVGGFVIPSAHKVGGIMEHLGVNYATESGDMEFDTPKDTSKFAKLNFDLRFFGSQLEIKPYWKGKVVRATQHAVQVSADLYDNGVEISKEARMLDRQHNDIVNGIVRKSFRELKRDLEIEETEVNGVPAFRMSESSYEKLLDMLMDEASEVKVGKSLLSGIEILKRERSKFKFDYFVDRYRMETMFMSRVGKDIIKRKFFGEGMVQAPELGYEVGYIGNRKVKGTELGFYQDLENNWVMEVFMPHQFKELVGQDLRIARNGNIIVNGEMMENSAELLEAVGIRIPTDGKHSIEIIRIKGFLPHAAGPRMVVPGGLVLKAGSDFDIDKLITYLKSYRYENGVLRPSKFKDSVEEWFSGQQNFYRNEILGLFGDQINVQGVNIDPETMEEKIVHIKGMNELMEVLFNEFKGTDIFTRHNLENVLEMDLEYLTDRNEELGKGDFKEVAEKLLERISQFYSVQENEGVYTISPRSFESWREENPELDKYDVNSFGALQNKYMDTTRDILSLKDSRIITEFLRPVNTDTYNGLAKRIMKKDPTLPNLEKITDYHRETRLPHLIRVTEAFLQGARVVGISALASTHHIKAQRAGLELNLEHMYNLPGNTNRKVAIHFEGFENAQEKISLSGIYDITGTRKISDNISQLVNASVDIVKKPIIHILNLGPELAPSALVLMRAGVPLDSIVYFLNQPIVRDYMKELAIQGSRLNRAIDEIIYPDDIVSEVKKRYNVESYIDNQYFSAEDLFKTIGKKPEDMSPKEMGMQQQVLQDLLMYLELGKDMTSAITAQSFDTKLPKSRAHLALIQGNYNSVVESGVFPGIERITESEDTFLKEMKDYNFIVQDVVKDLFVANDLLQPYKEARQTMLNMLTDKRNRMGMDDKLRVLERFEQFTISFILTRMENADNEVISDHAERLLFGDSTFAMKLSSILNSPNHSLRNNVFLRSLLPVVQEMRETSESEDRQNDIVEPQFKSMNIYDQNALYDSFMEIVEYDSKKKTRLAKDILYVTLLQAGTMNTPFSFLEQIPGDIFLRMSKDIFTQVENDPNALLVGSEELLIEFHKNMINDPNIVPFVKSKKSKKRLYMMFTKRKAQTMQSTRKIGEAKASSSYILEMNVPISDVSTRAIQLNTDGYTSRSYLNTTQTHGMSVRRSDNVEDLGDNENPLDNDGCK